MISVFMTIILSFFNNLRRGVFMYLNKELYKGYREYPERILQFGEGNFLRAFADWIIDKMNKELDFNGSVLVIQPRNNNRVYDLNKQDGLYTLLINGIDKGNLKNEISIVNSISRGLNTYVEYDEYLKSAENPDMRFVISNTTEAGIVFNEEDRLDDMPPSSFPAKLTLWLYHRYKFFNGDTNKGMLILPCELIENNGDSLKEIILKLCQNWNLEKGFIDWINNSNRFYNTLVDRIVPGYPKEKAKDIEKEIGYKDKFLVESEYFYLWVIEGDLSIKEEFPTDQLGLNVLFVKNLDLYRLRKVRILNGAHTTMVPVSYLYGLDTVKDSIDNPLIGDYIKKTIYNEIMPTLDLSKDELEDFAESVLDRFRNPFIKHYLMSISLNGMSKFKTRVLPSILEYKNRNNDLPKLLLFSLAATIYFYKGSRNGESINLSDDTEILELYNNLWSRYDGSYNSILYIVENILALDKLWDINLNDIPGMTKMVADYLYSIINNGIESALKEVL